MWNIYKVTKILIRVGNALSERFHTIKGLVQSVHPKSLIQEKDNQSACQIWMEKQFLPILLFAD